MNRKLLKVKIVFGFLLILSMTGLAQNTLQEQYAFAEELYYREKYFDAITELKRLLYFDDYREYSYKANKLIGQSYKEGGKFSEAIQYFIKAEINAENVDEIFNAKIEVVRINILRRTTGLAFSILDDLKEDPRFIKYNYEIEYWRGWSYVFNNEWQQAWRTFYIIEEDELADVCKNVYQNKYSVVTAKVLSYIIPGSGQFYTGHYFSGLLSLGWNALWGYLTVNSFIEDRVFDGLAIANFLWLRFYIGNIQNAEKFAVQENLKITNEALDFLQNSFKGIKP